MKRIFRVVIRRLSKISSQTRRKVDCLCRCVNLNSDPSQHEVTVLGEDDHCEEHNDMFLLRRKLKKSLLRKLKDEARGEDKTFKTVLNDLTSSKRLDTKQLENLVKSVKDKCDSVCVFVKKPNVPVQLGTQEVPPYFAVCKLWRWINVKFCDINILKPTPLCSDISGRTCCNPYHWSLQVGCGFDYPPPPYVDILAKDMCVAGIISDSGKAKSELGSTETGSPWSPSSASPVEGSESAPSNPWSNPWCRIGYWEKKDLLNGDNLYPVHMSSVQVFQSLPHASGLCLESVQNGISRTPDPGGGVLKKQQDMEVLSARAKIGTGIILSLEGSEVWVYNRGEESVYIHSPLLMGLGEEQPSPTTPLKPGQCIIVFDYSQGQPSEPELPQAGPYDMYSVKLSFVKGFGWARSKESSGQPQKTYTRQSILECPCWIEILLQKDKNR